MHITAEIKVLLDVCLGFITDIPKSLIKVSEGNRRLFQPYILLGDKCLVICTFGYNVNFCLGVYPTSKHILTSGVSLSKSIHEIVIIPYAVFPVR